MSGAWLWRVLASVVAFVLIIAGQVHLAGELFALWVGALLLAANTLQVLLTRYLPIRGPSRSCRTHAQLSQQHSGSAEPPAPPAERERELNELQAQLTTLEDQFATELHNSNVRS